MKALSIKQPGAHLILHHGKDCENRTWRTHYHGPLLIHAGKKVDTHVCKSERLFHKAHRDSWPLGAIVGVVNLARCDEWIMSRWDEPNHWHWRLTRPRYFSKPVQYRGQLGLFNVPDELVADALVSAKEAV